MPIKNAKDYGIYLLADLVSHGKVKWDSRYKYEIPELYYQRLLRKVEYLSTLKNNKLNKLRLNRAKKKLDKLSLDLGIDISPGTMGPGLKIVGRGPISINEQVKVGKNCELHTGVVIYNKGSGSPTLGNNIFIAPGVKISGDIKIGNNVTIEANSFVNKDIKNNTVVGGNPAIILKEKQKAIVNRGYDRVKEMIKE